MAYYKYQTDGKSKRELAEFEKFHLEGDLEIIPNAKFQATQSYYLNGLGSPFTGLYRFRSVTHTISTSGYTVTARVIQTKQGMPKSAKKKKSSSSRKKSSTKSVPNKKYTVVKGDTLSAISLRLTGKASNYKQIGDANHLKNDDLIYPGQVILIPSKLLKK